MLDSAAEPGTRRLNIRAAVLLVAVVALLVAGTVALYFYQRSRLRVIALKTAQRLVNEGQIDLAIRNLDAVLRTHPGDPEALELEGRLLAESAHSVDELINAATFNDQFVRVNPDAPGSQEARRRTVDLYIRFSELYQESSYYHIAPETSVFNMRYRAAVAVAKVLIERGATDAGARLLLARAEEGLAQTGDSNMVDVAIRDYEQTLEIDPADIIAAEHLANLLNDRKRDPVGAVAVLDALAKHRPDSAELRLARHRFFVKLGRDAEASAELEAALKLAPDDSAACLEAAEMALRRGRTGEARRFLEKIPAGRRDGLHVRLVLGLIELNENHPEEAMEIWRKGLISSRGSDAMLTWNLAFSFLQLGRLAEAGPLVSQYRRFMNDDSSPMLNLLLAIQEQKSGQAFKAAIRLEGIRERIDARWKQLLDVTLGRCYAETGDPTRAIAAYRRVLQENPRAVAIRVELADALTNARPHEAADILEAGLQARPDDPAMWVALALAQLRQQENLPAVSRSWESFDRVMSKAVALAPGHPTLTLIRSRRQSLDGKTDDATAMLEVAIRGEPRKIKLWEAYVDTLLKAGRPAEALGVLERASSPEAIGDTAGIRLARFAVLEGLGRSREARERLIKDVDKLQPDQRARIWAVLGRDLASRGDLSGARDAYAEWARQVADDIRPRLILLEMGLYGGEADARAAVDALHRLGGSDDIASRLDRARELIRSSPEGSSSSTPEDPRLREAERILETVRDVAPQVAAVDALWGELSERRGRVEDAALAYRRAWSKGSEEILPRLVDLLARHNPGDLERLGTLNGSPRVIRLVVQACIRIGQPDRAARIASGNPVASETPEAMAWRADLLERLGKPGRAETLLRAETARRPDAVEPWMTLLRSLAKQGQAEAIASTLEEAKTSIRDERADFVAARLCWAAGDRAGADRAFQASIDSRPDDVEVLLVASDYEQEVGRLSDAEAHLRRALTVDPGHRGASRRLAMYLTARPFDEAGWEIAWSVLGPESLDAKNPEDRLARAVLLSKGSGPDRRRRATDLLEALVADLSGDSKVASTARDLLARMFLEDRQFDRAIRLVGPKVEQGNGSPLEISLYAEALLASGRLDQAGLQLDRLATLAPGDAREARLRARLVATRARPGEAARDLERVFLAREGSPGAGSFGREAFAQIAAATPPTDDVAERLGLRLASKDPGASWMPAIIAGRHGRATEALRLCKAAAEVADPADAREAARVAFGVAVGDAKVDRREELEAILESASRRDPDGTEIPLQFAQLRHRQGRYEDVVRLYREVIARRPDLRPSIQNNIAWVLSEDLHRPDEAIKVVDDLLKAQGRTAAILDTRGVILTRLGRPDEAIKDLEDSSRIGPDPVHLFHLARAYRDAGKAGDFLRCRDLALRAGLTPELVEPSERADMTSMMRP